MNEIIAGSIFILFTADSLYCICKSMWCHHINFDQDIVFSNGKTSQIRAGRAKVFLSAFVVVKEAFGFQLWLDFWCLLTATAMDMTYSEIGHVKVIKSKLPIYLLFFCLFIPIEQASKILSSKHVTWRTCPADDLREKYIFLQVDSFKS